MATTEANSKTGNSASSPLTNSPVTESATEAAHQAVDAMSERASSAEDSIRKTTANSKAAIDQKQEEIKMQVQGSFERSKQFAQENPVTAAGIAFAAGILVSNFFGRGR